jgi:hypothetical protein
VVKVKAGPGSGSLYTEEDWNNESSMQDDHETYMYSKAWPDWMAHGKRRTSGVTCECNHQQRCSASAIMRQAWPAGTRKKFCEGNREWKKE